MIKKRRKTKNKNRDRIGDISEVIAANGLVGRGGAAYPTAEKWRAVKKALETKKIAYIVVNGAEGEPGVKKDGFILHHYPEEVIKGVQAADKYLGSKKVKKIYIFLNQEYYKKYLSGLKMVIGQKEYSSLKNKIEFVVKPEESEYIGGEETALINILEGRRAVPRPRPPYPTGHGLGGHPTLVNNVETFYNIGLLTLGQYQEKRFYTVSGAIKHPGVYCLPDSLTVEGVLKETGNWPIDPFFVQVGGEASGEILNSEQLEQPVEGAGSIMVYNLKKTDENKLFQRWIKFYLKQSCGHCSACREGIYHLDQLINQKKFDHKLFWEIVSSLESSSFCSLGSSLPVPLTSYLNNIKKIN